MERGGRMTKDEEVMSMRAGKELDIKVANEFMDDY